MDIKKTSRKSQHDQSVKSLTEISDPIVERFIKEIRLMIKEKICPYCGEKYEGFNPETGVTCEKCQK